MKGKLSHIEIYVSDLERSAAFWGWLLSFLGYDQYQKWANGRSWIKDKTYIVLVQTAAKYQKNRYNRCNTGLNHLAFYADSREEIDQLTSELRKRDFNILYEDRHPYAGGKGNYAVYFEDPDRIKVEIVTGCDENKEY